VGAEIQVRELTRRDRLLAMRRLDVIGDELSAIAAWLNQLTDAAGRREASADKSAVLIECAARDVLAACWVLKPPDRTLPDGHLDGRISGPLNGANTAPGGPSDGPQTAHSGGYGP
jgi:hypothetical protein